MAGRDGDARLRRQSVAAAEGERRVGEADGARQSVAEERSRRRFRGARDRAGRAHHRRAAGAPRRLRDPRAAAARADRLGAPRRDWRRRRSRTMRAVQMTVARALVASALTKARANDPAAWEDLHAVWKLARSLDGASADDGADGRVDDGADDQRGRLENAAARAGVARRAAGARQRAAAARGVSVSGGVVLRRTARSVSDEVARRLGRSRPRDR